MRLLITRPSAAAFVLAAALWWSGAIGEVDAQGQSAGKGWLAFGFAGDSIDYAIIADYVQASKGYAESQARRPWRIVDLQVAYHDLNDDGVPEMVLSYADVDTYHCGTGGCDTIIFQRRGGRWQEVGEGFMFAPWVSDEIVGGYRTLFTGDGPGLRWSNGRYRDFCTESPPAEIRHGDSARCAR